MRFQVDVTMTQKKEFCWSHILESFLLTFTTLMLKLSLRGTMPDILTIRLSDWVFLATLLTDFAILSGGNYVIQIYFYECRASHFPLYILPSPRKKNFIHKHYDYCLWISSISILVLVSTYCHLGCKYFCFFFCW